MINKNKIEPELTFDDYDESSISKLTIDEQIDFPDFDEDYDKAIKEQQLIIDYLTKKLRFLDMTVGVLVFLVIPCLVGFLNNDSLKGCEVKTIAVTKKG